MLPNSSRNEDIVYSFFRILECVICCVCLGISIHILLYTTPSMNIILKALLLLVAAIFVFLTFTDLILIWMIKPFTLVAWIMMALTGALVCFVCVGFLIFLKQLLGADMHILALLAYYTAGMFFFCDICYLLIFLLRGDSDDDSTSDCFSTVSPTYTEKCIQVPGNDRELFLLSSDKCVQCSEQETPRLEKFVPCCKRRHPSRGITSHGGTFHVSKDATPILSPSPVRTTRNENSPPHSKPAWCTPPTHVVEPVRNVNECGSSNERPHVKNKTRTVAISVRTVPKQSEEQKLLAKPTSICHCGASDTQHRHGDAYCDLDVNHASSEYHQTPQHPCYPHENHMSPQNSYHTASSVSFVEPLHRNFAKTHGLTLNRDPCQTCCRLSPIQENSSYIVTDEPTKDDSFFASYHSPQPSHSNLYAHKLDSSRTGCNQTPMAGSNSSISSFDKRYQSSQTFINRPNAIFAYEPKYRNEEIQTDSLISLMTVQHGERSNQGLSSEAVQTSFTSIRIPVSQLSLSQQQSSGFVIDSTTPSIIEKPETNEDTADTTSVSSKNKDEKKLESKGVTCDVASFGQTANEQPFNSKKKKSHYTCNCSEENPEAKQNPTLLYQKQIQSTEYVTLLPGAVDCSTNTPTVNAERYIMLPDDSPTAHIFITSKSFPIYQECSSSSPSTTRSRDRPKHRCILM